MNVINNIFDLSALFHANGKIFKYNYIFCSTSFIKCSLQQIAIQIFGMAFCNTFDMKTIVSLDKCQENHFRLIKFDASKASRKILIDHIVILSGRINENLCKNFVFCYHAKCKLFTNSYNGRRNNGREMKEEEKRKKMVASY